MVLKEFITKKRKILLIPCDKAPTLRCGYILVANKRKMLYNIYTKLEEVIAMDDKQYLLSVVIPVYNMKGYLERCIDSVLSDFSDDMQIILVDDGSQDESPAICDRYAREYENIFVIHQQNAGISATRNNGIKAATGEYIFFLDSDDAVQPEIFSKFRTYIKNVDNAPDMLLIDCVFVHDVTGQESDFVFPVGYDKLHNVSGQEALKHLLTAKPNFEWYCWRYFYRRAFLQNTGLQFPVGITFEDVPWTSQCLTLAERVDYLPEVGLRYTNCRKGSIVNSMSLKKVRDKLYIADASCKFDKEHIQDPELLDIMLSNHGEYFVGAFRNFCDSIPEAYPYLKEYAYLCQYSKTRFGRFLYKAIRTFGFAIGSRMAKMMFFVMGLDKQ